MNKNEKSVGSNVEISALSEEDRLLIEKMEKGTDALWANKKEADFAYEKIKEFLPARKVEHPAKDGEDVSWEVPLKWEEIEQLEKSGQLHTATEEVARKKLEGKFSGKILESKIRNVRRRISGLISKGLKKYKEAQKKDNLEERLGKYSQAKTKEEKDEIWKQIPPEMKMISKFRRFRLKELVRGKKELEKKNGEIENILFDLDIARNDGDLEAVGEINKEYKKKVADYKKTLYSSPEIYYWRRMLDLKEMKDCLDENGRIVETPYVKEVMAMIDSLIGSKRPVFIHGELGSGKSEVAKHSCRKIYSQKHLERWEDENPKPEHPGEIDDWNARREKEKEPFVISGHKNMDIGEVLGGRGMELSACPSPEEQLRITEDAIRKFEADEKIIGKEATDEQKEFLREAYREGFKNFVQVKEVLGLFYQAMKEGRPVILDEMNAIPHSVLIALNDLLGARQGDRIMPMIPGAEPFEVVEGFVVLATGNWKPEDGKAYVGRQQIDAAFLSRFGIVSFDYLPQRIKGETAGASDENKRREKAESELFILLATHILDSDTLGANVPSGTFEKLRGLAQAARVLQDAFSEKGNAVFTDSDSGADIPAKDILKENVLSIRHLIPILENWKKDGFCRELDDYVMLHFVDRSSVSRPMEKKFVYQIIQSISDKNIFSTEGDKWPDGFSKKGLNDVENYPIRKKMFGFDGEIGHKKPIEEEIEKAYYSPQQVVEEIFGPAPKRKMVDKRLFEQSETVGGADDSGSDIETKRENVAISIEVENLLDGILSGGYGMSEEEKTFFEEFRKEERKKQEI